MNFAGLKLVRDDGAAIYLNGKSVAARNLPKVFPRPIMRVTNVGITIVFNTTNHLMATDFIPVPASDFTTSSNLLAVEVHQSTNRDAADFDLRFVLALYALLAYDPGAALQIGAAPGMATMLWPDYVPDWQLQQSPDLVYWTNVVNVPLLTNAQSVLQFPLQKRMFFRLGQSP